MVQTNSFKQIWEFRSSLANEAKENENVYLSLNA